MASLDAIGVKSMRFDNVPGRTDQKFSTWLLTLQSTADTLTVPALEYSVTTSSCKVWDTANLAGGVIASADGLANEGVSIVNITGGSYGQEVILTCMHRRGILNNMHIDEDPT